MPDLAECARVLRRFGVRELDLELPLHQDLVETIGRVWGAPEGALNVALSWCWQAELLRQGEARARADSAYKVALGKAIVGYRRRGEKSADVAEKRAESEDDAVVAAHLEAMVAERLEYGARAALRILEMANDNYRTRVASERAADRMHAQDPSTT